MTQVNRRPEASGLGILLLSVLVASCATPPNDAEGADDGTTAEVRAGSTTPENSPAPGVEGQGGGVAAAPPSLSSLYLSAKAPGLDERRFTAAEYWAALEPVVAKDPGITLTSIGRSAEGRPLHVVRLGQGSTPVLLWSQMHGNESTASMALVDVLNFLATRPTHPTAQSIRQNLTIAMVPVLNPDGAERFERRNAQGIDINRDARALQTPEGRALKMVRDQLEPQFAFNLHDQQVGTRVGESSRGAAIALLAPPDHESRRITRVRDRAFRVAAVIRDAIEPYARDHISKYDDTFNPRAFGDLMTQWGASTVLIESGGLSNDPQKQELRKINFIAIVSALEAIATGSYTQADPERYHELPFNGRAIADLVIRGGTLRIPGLPDLKTDILIDYDDPLLERGGVIADIGDLADVEARDTIDATGLYILALDEALEYVGEQAHLRVGAPAYLIASPVADGSVPEWDFRGHLERKRR